MVEMAGLRTEQETERPSNYSPYIPLRNVLAIKKKLRVALSKDVPRITDRDCFETIADFVAMKRGSLGFSESEILGTSVPDKIFSVEFEFQAYDNSGQTSSFEIVRRTKQIQSRYEYEYKYKVEHSYLFKYKLDGSIKASYLDRTEVAQECPVFPSSRLEILNLLLANVPDKQPPSLATPSYEELVDLLIYHRYQDKIEVETQIKRVRANMGFREDWHAAYQLCLMNDLV